MKNVLILATGGTIVSEMGENGLEPAQVSSELMAFIEVLKKNYNIKYKSILNLDSSNIQPEEWKLIATNTFDAIKEYDGVVITHGTDTLAYTAAMLSFMLQNLSKPVILTGSQLPINSFLSDAKTNLATAFAAIEAGVCGVNIAFNYKIINATRAVKVRTMGFNAFESVNFPVVAEILSERISLGNVCNLLPPKVGELSIKTDICCEVFLLKLIPGTNPDIFDFLLNSGYKGVVLEAFGVGGLHYIRRDLLDKIKLLVDSGIAVVVCSQCLYETSDLSIYEPGRKILQAGVISAKDMTTESAVTKLMWSLGQTESLSEIANIFNTNFVGEVTL